MLQKKTEAGLELTAELADNSTATWWKIQNQDHHSSVPKDQKK